jgi:hypothetical protein
MKRYIQSAVQNILDDSIDNQAMIAMDLSTPIEVLRQLGESNENQVIWGLAGNPNTPVDILQKCADRLNSLPTYDYPFLRLTSALGHNPKIPSEMITSLVETFGNYRIAPQFASNPNTPIELLQEWANLNSTDIGKALIRNPNLPANIYDQVVTTLSGELQTVFNVIFEMPENVVDATNRIKKTLKENDAKLKEFSSIWEDELYEHYGDEDNPDLELAGFEARCLFIPEDYLCDDICDEIELQLSNAGVNVIEVNYLVE